MDKILKIVGFIDEILKEKESDRKIALLQIKNEKILQKEYYNIEATLTGTYHSSIVEIEVIPELCLFSINTFLDIKEFLSNKINSLFIENEEEVN